LFHEVAFYAAFCLAIFSKRIGGALLALWFAVCLIVFQYPDSDERTGWLVYTAGYNLNFLIGMAAFVLAGRLPTNGARAATVAGVAAVVALVAGRYEGLGHDVASLPLALSFGLVIAGLVALEREGKVAVPKPLVLIGVASYTLYLTHEAFEGLLLKIVRHVPWLGGEEVYVLVAAGTVVIGVVVYLLVERPILERLKGGLRNRPSSDEKQPIGAPRQVGGSPAESGGIATAPVLSIANSTDAGSPLPIPD
jgi:peptidoglycan/LPS O-acetylase OafA/YrhL